MTHQGGIIPMIIKAQIHIRIPVYRALTRHCTGRPAHLVRECHTLIPRSLGNKRRALSVDGSELVGDDRFEAVAERLRGTNNAVSIALRMM